MKAILTLAKMQEKKKNKCPSTDNWIGKLSYIQIFHCYAAIKWKELKKKKTQYNAMKFCFMTHPENTMLS